MLSNCGTTNSSIADMISTTSATTATGYVIADLILPRRCTSRSSVAARLSRVSSSDPPVSPDFTIEM